jgi:hypothetical protein
LLFSFIYLDDLVVVKLIVLVFVLVVFLLLFFRVRAKEATFSLGENRSLVFLLLFFFIDVIIFRHVIAKLVGNIRHVVHIV